MFNKNKKNDTIDLINLLNQVQDSLNYSKLIGFNSFHCSENTLNIINKWYDEKMSITSPNKSEELKNINIDLHNCNRCSLSRKRNNIVFGEGNQKARLVFIGEGPGREEDKIGKPFVGPAGQLLTRIIKAMGFDRKDIYICNVVKCRPPGNRNPNKEEIKSCIPFLKRQINSISPKVICVLGSIALNSLLSNDSLISRLRGNFIKIPELGQIKIMPTYHPAYLLRNPKEKKKVWEDMKKIMKIIH